MSKKFILIFIAALVGLTLLASVKADEKKQLTKQEIYNMARKQCTAFQDRSPWDDMVDKNKKCIMDKAQQIAQRHGLDIFNFPN